MDKQRLTKIKTKIQIHKIRGEKGMLQLLNRTKKRIICPEEVKKKVFRRNEYISGHI